MSFRSLRELQSFVRSLDVPEERREVVEAELLDHFFARIGDGATEAEALAAFGAKEALRIRFEPVERGFRLTRRDAVRDGARLGGAFLTAAAAAALTSGAYWWVWRQLWFQMTDAWHPRWALDAIGRAAEVGQFTDALIQIGFTVAFLAWALRARRWGRGLRAEIGAPALHFALSSGLGLVAALSFLPLLGSVMARVHLYTGDLGGSLALAVWAASSVLLLIVGPVGATIASRSHA